MDVGFGGRALEQWRSRAWRAGRVNTLECIHLNTPGRCRGSRETDAPIGFCVSQSGTPFSLVCQASSRLHFNDHKLLPASVVDTIQVAARIENDRGEEMKKVLPGALGPVTSGGIRRIVGPRVLLLGDDETKTRLGCYKPSLLLPYVVNRAHPSPSTVPL